MKKGRSRLRWVSQLMLPGRQAWNEQLLSTCLLPRDVEEVLKIRLSNRNEEDFIGWHYERSAIFTVKSAYKLALRMEYKVMGNEGSSSCADGSQSLYKKLWSVKVPPKVRLFAWKLSEEGLATQDNRKRRTLVREDICTICGMEKETGYHAMVRCSKAATLRAEMRRHWTLLAEELLRYTGPDWLLLLLCELHGVRLVAQLEGKPMYAKSDCLSLFVRALQEEHEDRFAWAGVIAEIKRAGNLQPGCRYIHVCRDANMVAHMLASHSAIMRHDMPSFVHSQVEVFVGSQVEVEAACNSATID
jgi:hypothetical protein